MTEQRIIISDFYSWCNDNLADNSIDAVITDPPYPAAFLPLWSQLGEVSARVLKPSGMLIAYSGHYNLPAVISRLSEHLSYYWMGCLKHMGATGVVFPSTFIAGWKPILFYQKPPFKRLKKATSDFFVSGGRDKLGHVWKQSVSGVWRLVDYFTEPEDLILEPFAGAGTTLVACKMLNRNCIGIELDKQYLPVIQAAMDVNYLFTEGE